MPVLMTQRLILRAWREEDAKELYMLAKDPRVGATAGWSPHKSPRESLATIRDVYSQPEIYALVLREMGEVIGSAGLMTHENSSIGLARTDCEIGYWLGVPYWGNGYALEASASLIRRAFTVLEKQRVFCSYIEGNQASQRVCEKLGFAPHHVNRGAYSGAMGAKVNEYVTCISRQDWIFKNTKGR